MLIYLNYDINILLRNISDDLHIFAMLHKMFNNFPYQMHISASDYFSGDQPQ